MMNSTTSTTTSSLGEYSEQKSTTTNHHHHSTIPFSMPNIVNNTFHTNFEASLLPFTFAPPPSRFFSLLHHDSDDDRRHHPYEDNQYNQKPSKVIITNNNASVHQQQTIANNNNTTTTNSGCSNCSSSSSHSCSNNLQQQQQQLSSSVSNNVFVPNQCSSSNNYNSSTCNNNSDSISSQRKRSSSSASNKTSTSSTTTKSQQEQIVNKNQELLDAPASVLLLEPPSLSTIIDDHHPTIPTSAYYLKKQEEEEYGPNNNPSLLTTSPKHALDFKKRSFSHEAEEISVENCDESVCLTCGCEEDKVEAELRLQDKLERKSHKRRMEGSDEDEQMSDDNTSSTTDNSTKKRKMLSKVENLEALSSVLHQLEPDCVLHIFEFLSFSGKDYWFTDIRNMYGRFRYNNQILPLFKFVTIEQHSPLTLDETNNHGAINCNIQSLTIERRTNQPLECETGYLKKLGNALKTFIYYNRSTNLSKNVSNLAISMMSDEQNGKPNQTDVMGYLSSEDEVDLSSFELIEDENSHVIGLKRRARSEGSCFLREVYRNCRVLEKLKIVDIKGYVPFKVSMRPGTNRPVDCLAFTNTLTKIRLYNCMLPNHTLQAISKMVNLKSLHFEKIFVSDPNQYDVLLKLRNLEVLKIEVSELPLTVLRNLPTSLSKLTKLYINVLSNGSFDENLRVDQLKELRYLALVSHFKVDLLSIMRNCQKLKHLHLGFDVCFNHIFPNERLTSCILRNVFISPDRSKVLIQNNTLVNLQLSPASIRAAQKELTFIKQQRQALGKPTLSITEFSQ